MCGKACGLRTFSTHNLRYRQHAVFSILTVLATHNLRYSPTHNLRYLSYSLSLFPLASKYPMMSTPSVVENVKHPMRLGNRLSPAHPRQGRAREKRPVTPQAERVPVWVSDPCQRLKKWSQRGVSLRSPIGPRPLRGVRRATAAGENQGGQAPMKSCKRRGEPSGLWQQLFRAVGPQRELC